jgi:DNA-binding MarR family transcriptional regulator
MSDTRRTDTYSLLFDLFALNQDVRRLLGAAMAESPLRPDEYAAYSVVFEEEALTQTAMAARLGLPLTTVAEHVRAMERRGHARRVPNPGDDRSFLLVLTGDGLAAHRDASRCFERVYAAFLGSLAVGEGEARRGLRALRDAAIVAGDTALRESSTRGTVPDR